MKLFIDIRLICFLIFCFGCQVHEEKANKESDQQPIVKHDNENGLEPTTCVDWSGFYGHTTRDLDSFVNKTSGVKVKDEGYDKYNSANRLEGVYVLTNKDIAIDKIGELAKYLAYKLCLSDNKRFNGVFMDCNERKIHVAIARSEKNYIKEAWAVVYNIFPLNKKGKLDILDFIK